MCMSCQFCDKSHMLSCLLLNYGLT